MAESMGEGCYVMSYAIKMLRHALKEAKQLRNLSERSLRLNPKDRNWQVLRRSAIKRIADIEPAIKLLALLDETRALIARIDRAYRGTIKLDPGETLPMLIVQLRAVLGESAAKDVVS